MLELLLILNFRRGLVRRPLLLQILVLAVGTVYNLLLNLECISYFIIYLSFCKSYRIFLS